MSRFRVAALSALVAASVVVLTACSSASSLGSSPSGSGAAGTAAARSFVVGSANFPESVTLAHIYGGALASHGYTVSYDDGIGARDAYLAALKGGEIDLVPEYAGALLTTLDGKANAKSGAAVKAGIDAKIGTLGADALDLADAADSDSLNVTKQFASQHHLRSIADLREAGHVTLAANPEFAARPDGIASLKRLYGLTHVSFKAINDGGGNSTLHALLSNQVQVADIYTTTPSISENGLVTLEDPKNQFASQQVLPIVREQKATEDVRSILNGVSAQLSTKDLLALDAEVLGSRKVDPATAAGEWLEAHDH